MVYYLAKTWGTKLLSGNYNVLLTVSSSLSEGLWVHPRYLHPGASKRLSETINEPPRRPVGAYSFMQ